MRVSVAVAALALAAALSVVLLGNAAGAASACPVSTKQVKTILHVRVSAPSIHHAGLLECVYASKGEPEAVLVEVQKHTNKTVWTELTKNIGGPLTTVKGLGRQAVYAKYVDQYALYVWTGKTTLVITSFAPPAKEEALAKKALSHV